METVAMMTNSLKNRHGHGFGAAAPFVSLFAVVVPLCAGVAVAAVPTPPASPAARAGSPPARARNSAAPQLSIGVTDGKKSARPGDTLAYTVNVRNIGSSSAPRLDIIQTLPPGFRLQNASRPADRRSGRVMWTASLRPGRAAEFRVVGQVGRTPPQLLRLATIACVTVGGSATPLVCAAHSDELPAGAAAGHRRRAAAAGPHAQMLRYVLVAGAVVLLAAAGLVVRRRFAAGSAS